MPKHLVILGAGPGGYVAAIRAAQLGANVTVIEGSALGGVCLNAGCIPSKALLSVVEVGEKAIKSAELGLLKFQGPIAFDLPQMVARKNKVVEGLVKGVWTLFKSWGIQHVEGMGEIIDRKTVKVRKRDGSEELFGGDALILATGSSWPNLPQFPIDGRRVLTSKEALDLTLVPRRLLIVGGGVEGCEFASLYSGLGTEVTIVELLPRILPLEDEDISSLMARELTKRRVIIYVGTSVEKIELGQDVVKAALQDGTVLEVDTLLVSVGRGFNSKGIGLEAVGVKVGRRGEILVNARMETNIAGIYAIGDVVGKAMLAHVASAQGKVAAENIVGHHPQEIDYRVVPAGIFTLPEVGRVGMTEDQARDEMVSRGEVPAESISVGRFRYSGLGKAQGTGDTSGFVKIISETKTNKILGTHIIGAHATDLIHEAALAMRLDATVSDMAGMIHAHPTFAEGMMEAAEDVNSLAIHVPRKRHKPDV